MSHIQAAPAEFSKYVNLISLSDLLLSRSQIHNLAIRYQGSQFTALSADVCTSWLPLNPWTTEYASDTVLVRAAGVPRLLPPPVEMGKPA
jgi:hypothetical protein